MNVNLCVGAVMALSNAVAVGAQSAVPTADDIAATIAVARKITNNEPLTDKEKSYGFGLRLLDTRGPVVVSIQGPLNRIFTNARTAAARHRTFTPADVSDSAKEPAIIAIAVPNTAYELWDTHGPARISEILFKALRPGEKDPRIIRPEHNCLFSPLEYKKKSGEVYKAQLAVCRFPLDLLSSPGTKFEVSVVHDQGEWSRGLLSEDLRLVR